ncbi:hypothetical protein KCV07_g77, partial [Aureobasidium melanogenum]
MDSPDVSPSTEDQQIDVMRLHLDLSHQTSDRDDGSVVLACASVLRVLTFCSRAEDTHTILLAKQTAVQGIWRQERW